jgi:predicted peptidase
MLSRHHWRQFHRAFSLLGGLIFCLQEANPCAAETKRDIPDAIKFAMALSLDKEHLYTGGRYSDHSFRYRLFLPRPYDPEQKYPLILWLHGAGSERGSDNWSQLRYIGTHVYHENPEGVYPFFVLAPQCPLENREGLWQSKQLLRPPGSDGEERGDEMLTVAIDILDQTIRDYPIDDNRIFLIGISSGGNAAWEAAIRYPQRFAAVAPIASAGASLKGIRALSENHIWCFHVRADTGTVIHGARDTVSAVRALGGRCYLTETPGVTHDCWTPALLEFGLIDWLLQQKKDGEGTVPGYWKIKNEFQLAIEAGALYSLPVPTIFACLWLLWRSKKGKLLTNNQLSTN